MKPAVLSLSLKQFRAAASECFFPPQIVVDAKTEFVPLSSPVAAQWILKNLTTGRRPYKCQYGWVIAHFCLSSPTDTYVIIIFLSAFPSFWRIKSSRQNTDKTT